MLILHNIAFTSVFKVDKDNKLIRKNNKLILNIYRLETYKKYMFTDIDNLIKIQNTEVTLSGTEVIMAPVCVLLDCNVKLMYSSDIFSIKYKQKYRKRHSSIQSRKVELFKPRNQIDLELFSIRSSVLNHLRYLYFLDKPKKLMMYWYEVDSPETTIENSYYYTEIFINYFKIKCIYVNTTIDKKYYDGDLSKLVNDRYGNKYKIKYVAQYPELYKIWNITQNQLSKDLWETVKDMNKKDLEKWYKNIGKHTLELKGIQLKESK